MLLIITGGFKRLCKFWLEPEIALNETKKGDFSEKELIEIKGLVIENKELLIKQLDIFYNQQQVKAIRK